MRSTQKTDKYLPEILFTGEGDPSYDRWVNRLAAADKLKKLYQGIYTSNLDSPLESIVIRYWGDR